MSEHEFDNYLKLLSGILKLSRHQATEIAGELRAHLEERMADLMTEGKSREEAIAMALEEFGDAAGLASGFRQVALLQRKRQMLRWTSMSVAAASLGFLMLWSMWPERARVQFASSSMAQSSPLENGKTESTEADAGSETALDSVRNGMLSKLVTLQAQDAPLSAVVSAIQDQTGVMIVLQQHELESVSVPLDTPVNLDVKNVQLRSALALLGDALQLDWLERDGLLLITSADAASQQPQTRTYDIGDLMAHAMETGQSEFMNLPDLIVQQIDSDSWQENGGEGTLSVLEQSLVVRQTPRTHDQIQCFLAALKRQLSPASSVRSTEPIDVTPYPEVLQALKQAMNKPLGEIRFEEAHLSAVVQLLADKTQVPIRLDVNALDDAGIPVDTPITLAFTKPTLRMVLESLTDHHQLMWAYRNEAILITTADQVLRYGTVRLYPIHDLERIDHVIEVLCKSTSVGQAEYLENGGEGIISPVLGSGLLAINQIDAVHEQIDRVLREVRKSRRVRSGEAATTDVRERRVYHIVSSEVEPKQLLELLSELIPASELNDPKTVRILGSRMLINERPGVHRLIEAACHKELHGMLSPSGGFSGGGMGGGAMGGVF